MPPTPLGFIVENVQYVPNAEGVIVACRCTATEGPFRGDLKEAPITQADLSARAAQRDGPGAIWSDDDVRAVAEAWLQAYIPGATLALRPVPGGAP